MYSTKELTINNFKNNNLFSFIRLSLWLMRWSSRLMRCWRKLACCHKFGHIHFMKWRFAKMYKHFSELFSISPSFLLRYFCRRSDLMPFTAVLWLRSLLPLIVKEKDFPLCLNGLRDRLKHYPPISLESGLPVINLTILNFISSSLFASQSLAGCTIATTRELSRHP